MKRNNLIKFFVILLLMVSLYDGIHLFTRLYDVSAQSVSLSIIMIVYFAVLYIKGNDKTINNDNLKNSFIILKVMLLVLLIGSALLDKNWEFIDISKDRCNVIKTFMEIFKLGFIEILTKILFYFVK